MDPCLAALGRHPASAVFIWNVAATSGPAQQLWQSLVGRLDSVIGHIVTAVDSADPEDIRISGRSRRQMLPYTGSPRHRAPGTVFELTTEELSQANAYEVADYESGGLLGLWWHLG